MQRKSESIFVLASAWTLTVLVIAVFAGDLWSHRDELLPVLPVLACLTLGAGLASAVSAARRAAAVRLAPAFILAALLALPPSAVLVPGLVASLPGLGSGVAGPRTRTPGGLLGALVSIGALRYFHAVWGSHLDPASLLALVHAVLLFALMQAIALGLTRLADLAAGETHERAAPWTRWAVEAINVPLAWLIVSLLVQAGRVPSLVFGLMVLVGGFALRRLDRAMRRARHANVSLGARVTELSTLHAIGREILASQDLSRILAIVERECRKILPADAFFIALIDRETRELRPAHLRTSGRAAKIGIPLSSAELASWVSEQKRAIRIDDAREDANLPFPAPVAAGMRSALVVPLIVEEVVIGVLSVQSRRAHAYDDHLLSVLSTVGQQAAVAIENARHYEMATVDSLTGLYVREYFFRRLEEEYERAHRYRGCFSLLMLDLDGFKAINDDHGHLVGDRYLRALGTTIRSRLRATDLACRYGGDEFCVLLPETDQPGAHAIAERIRQDVAALVVDVDALVIRTTASIGLAVFPDHDAGDLKTLLRKADEALYRAKRQGRDRVVPWAA